MPNRRIDMKLFNYNGSKVNAFTVRCVQAAEKLAKARMMPKGQKGAIPSLSIHRKPVYGRSLEA